MLFEHGCTSMATGEIMFDDHKTCNNVACLVCALYPSSHELLPPPYNLCNSVCVSLNTVAARVETADERGTSSVTLV